MTTRNLTILVTGSEGSGKSSIVRRIAENTFKDEYTPTRYTDEIYATLVTEDGTSVRIVFMDTDGKRAYEGYSINYYTTNMATIVIYDVSDQTSMTSVKEICEDIRRYCRKPCTVLVGNKSDKKRNINKDEIEEFAKQEKMPHIETSAKTNTNIKEMIMSLVKRLLEKTVNKDGKTEESSSAKRRKRHSIESLESENDSPTPTGDDKNSSTLPQTAKTSANSSCCVVS